MNEEILVVEDDQTVCMVLADRLHREGYRVKFASDGEEGFHKATKTSCHLVILGVMLRHRNGFDVCRDIRMAGGVVPILMLTSPGQTMDRVLGLRIGADDCLTKPFDAMELLARIEALLRRARTSVTRWLHQFGSLKLDLRRTCIEREGKLVRLSAREFQLMRYFVEHPGVILSREVLLKEVWAYNTHVYTRTLDVHVANLRQKIEPDPKYPALILTVPRLGYKFVP